MAPKKKATKTPAGVAKSTNAKGAIGTETGSSKPSSKAAGKPAGVKKPGAKSSGKKAGPEVAPNRPTRAGRHHASNESEEHDGQEEGEGEGEGEVELKDVEVLAEVDEAVQCTFKHEDAKLTTRLQVHKDPDNFVSRLSYRARFFLAHTLEGDEREDDIGYLESWRIDKPTAVSPEAKTAWLKETMGQRVVVRPEAIRETASCLEALYTQKGQPKFQLRKDGHETELADNSLIFIQMIYIRTAFARNGLLEHAFRSYHALLAELSDGFAFAGTLVLVPARPSGPRGKAWGDAEDEEVEAVLQTIYGRYGYTVWAENVKVNDIFITVMGRTVPDDAATADGGDSRVEPV